MHNHGTAGHSLAHSPARGRVSGKWPTIIAALLTSRTDLEAAALAKISRRTLSRLKNDPKFAAEVQKAKDAQLAGAVNGLRGNAQLFSDTLKAVADDAKQPGNARVRASEVGLNVLLKATEALEIVTRIQRLEAAAEDKR